MSQFDKKNGAQYIRSLSKFLGYSKSKLDKLIADYMGAYTGTIRIPHKNTALVNFLETKTNSKASRIDAPDSTIGERYKLARDYAGFTDARVAKEMDVSHELPRLWRKGKFVPKNTEKLAQILNVPLSWLEDGDACALPANSLMGVRVGAENQQWREALLGMSQSVVANLPVDADEDFVRAHLEWAVFHTPQMAQAARKAGGRWQMLNGQIVFAPWIAREVRKSTRAPWPDEVENIIKEEMGKQPSVTQAWLNMKNRCEALGYSSEEYPTRIALFKRSESARTWAAAYGVNMNDVIADSVRKYAN